MKHVAYTEHAVKNIRKEVKRLYKATTDSSEWERVREGYVRTYVARGWKPLNIEEATEQPVMGALGMPIENMIYGDVTMRTLPEGLRTRSFGIEPPPHVYAIRRDPKLRMLEQQGHDNGDGEAERAERCGPHEAL